MNCPQCNKSMGVEWEEALGVTLYCDYCNIEVSKPYDSEKADLPKHTDIDKPFSEQDFYEPI